MNIVDSLFAKEFIFLREIENFYVLLGIIKVLLGFDRLTFKIGIRKRSTIECFSFGFFNNFFVSKKRNFTFC